MGSDDLHARLQSALEKAVMGQNLGPALIGQIARTARMELNRAGVRGGKVVVRAQGRGFEVQVLLPPDPARVREIVLQLG